MIIGDPYKIAFWIDIVPKWNDVDATWINGIFSFCINGKIYPSIETSTLNSLLPELINRWHDWSMPCDNEVLFKASRIDAFNALLEITFQAARYEDYRYRLSTQTMEDNGIYSFALAHKDEVRILIATVSYNDNCLELDETKIDEIIISRSEIHSMICELDSYYKRTINNKRLDFS